MPQAGWNDLAFAAWDNLTPQLLKTCKLVVLAAMPARSAITAADEVTATMLADYVQGGGGLLLNQQGGQMTTSMRLPFYLADRFGTQLLYETIISDPTLTWQIGPWPSDLYTYTNQISGLFNQNVTGVLYHSYSVMGIYNGVLPFLQTSSWQVALSAGVNSSSVPYLCGLADIDSVSRSQGFSTHVLLVGVKDNTVGGYGRVGYNGIENDAIFYRTIASSSDNDTYNAYMKDGYNGYSSQLQQFYLNLFQWLSANSDHLSTTNLTRASVPTVSYTTAWKLHKGIIGARTSYSTGLSTPDQYATAAKAAGLDFIVFLENFDSLTPTEFESLKNDCARISAADNGTFLAIPGITYRNTDGNDQYAFGQYLSLPSSTFLTGTSLNVWPSSADQLGGKAITDLVWLHSLQGFENHSGWYRFSQSPYTHFDTRVVDSMGVVTQENGVTVEENLTAYSQEARNGQFLWPIALTLMWNAGEVSNLANGMYLQTLSEPTELSNCHRS